MEIKEPQTWEEFEEAIQSVRAQYGVFRAELAEGKVYERPNAILFRGQADSKWPLLTTLERKSTDQFSVTRYMHKVMLAQNELESFTGHRWNIPIWPELQAEIIQNQDVFRVHTPAYDFLVYLRHHGYPSPLLDWTESPYIAAFFAYVNSGENDPAVYCYIERPSSSKGGVGGEPMMSIKGPYVSTHKRHFAQKATYTIATQWNYKEEQHYFVPHDTVFSKENPKQDVLVKIVLPASLRTTALRKLSDYNINHFTLFQSEDSLVKSLEFKHFDLGEIYM